MAKAEEVKTSKLVFTASNGDAVTVSVADDKVEQRVSTGSGGFSKPTSRKTS